MNGAGHPVTIAFMDIDNFKNINDAWGHSTGDVLLVSVAECLRSQVWGTDVVARLGGDEYALLLPRTDAVAAQRVLARLKDTLLHAMAEAHWPVTFSIGTVTCLDSPPGIEELLHQADQLMYLAKRRGKNRIEYGMYPEALNPERYDDPDLEHLPQAPEVPSFHS
jgi:diguanylate cyclase (GGDEF)-like protein